MRQRLLIALTTLIAVGCPTPGEPDASVVSDAGNDASSAPCTRDSDCGDQGLFCSRWRCQPGMAGTDGRGCIDIGPPCESGQGCDEDARVCGAPAWCTEGRDGCLQPGDCDGDGSPNKLECGGDDCDDGDGDRYPGNPERCDASHDEDCNPATVGTTDEDSDGFVSSACCNGSNCGPDCDDTDGNVNPGAAEACDGIDNDCDGAIDEGSSGALCPGGMCLAGRCNFTGWDRTFGGAGEDVARGAAIDSVGNVYVVGSFSQTVRFGTTDEIADGVTGIFVVSFAPTGEYRWHRVYGGAWTQQARAIVVGPSDHLYIVGYMGGGAVDFGGPESPAGSGFLLSLTRDGEYRWHEALPGAPVSLAASTDGLSFVASFSRPEVDFGCGPLPGPSSDRLSHTAVVRYSSSGECTWQYSIPGGSPRKIGMSGTSVVVSGTFFSNLTIEGTTYSALGDDEFYVVSLAAETGAFQWGKGFTATGDVDISDMAVDGTGNIYAVGGFSGDFNLGPGRNASTASFEGFVLALDPSGDHRWHTFLDATGTDSAGNPVEAGSGMHGVSIGGDASVSIVGRFGSVLRRTTLDLGGGSRTADRSAAAFVVTYRSDGVFQRDFVVQTGALPTIHDIAVGPGDMTVWVGSFLGDVDLGSGPRSSAGSHDGFVVRVGT